MCIVEAGKKEKSDDVAHKLNSEKRFAFIAWLFYMLTSINLLFLQDINSSQLHTVHFLVAVI